MTQENFSEVEERIFALLDNADQTQTQVNDLLSKLTGVIKRLESSERTHAKVCRSPTASYRERETVSATMG